MDALERRTWKEFRDAGLLWWVNRMLHLFGWAIVVETEDVDGKVVDSYPARCRFRGFKEQDEAVGYGMLTHHIAEQLPEMMADLDWEHVCGTEDEEE